MSSGPTPALYVLVVENVRSGTTPGERLDPPARYQIQERETTIGRSPECSIRLDDIFVSRRHARLVLRDIELHLEDLESTNQSRVNGAPAPTRVRIHPGDVLLFGGARCRIESIAGAAAAPEAAAPTAPEATRTEEPTGEDSLPWPAAEPPRLHVAGPLPGEPRRTRLRVLAVVAVVLAMVAAAWFLL